MKKQRALHEMTHQDLFEALIYDENIQDNLTVSNDYSEDEYGNSRISMSFERMPVKRKKTEACIMVFVFSKKGRLVGIETATRKEGSKSWQVVVSEPFLDFSTRFGDDLGEPKKE